MNIQIRKLTELVYAEYNPRKRLTPADSEYKKIARSIDEFGYVDPIIINADNTIIGGHQRATVLKDKGFDEVQVVVLDISKEQEKALNVALNKISGEWNFEILRDLINDLDASGYDPTLTGFDLAEISDLLDQFHEDNAPEEDFDADAEYNNIAEPKTRRGDMWFLGEHRLFCGDSTKPDDVMRLMGIEKARMVFTDPPWNVDYGGSSNPKWKNGKDRQIMNDNMTAEDFYNFLLSAFKAMAAASEPGCMTYIVMSAQEWGTVMTAAKEAGYHWSSTIIWAKDRMVLSRKDYHTQYEPIWYGWLAGEKRLCPLTDRQQTDLWEFERPKKSDDHPTMKPLPLVKQAIGNSSHRGDVVLDLFGGSGSTLIACEQIKRKCRMMEYDPKYADVIAKRYVAFTGDADCYCVTADGVRVEYAERFG